MTQTVVDQAENRAETGKFSDALSLLESAGRNGDVDALYRLAVWHIAGKRLPRNLAKARTYLRCARMIGHVDAALMEIALIANGSGGPVDWAGAVALLRQAAQNDPVAGDHVALLDAMAIDAAGDPVITAQCTKLATSPATTLFKKLLTPGECAHIASVAANMMEPALVVDPSTGRYVAHPFRTSHAAVIGPAHETLVIQAINRRLAVASATGVGQGEPLTVLHYAPGQEYRPHHDALPPKQAQDNQRGWTMLIYLNDAYEGGATKFTQSGIEVQGRPGDVLLFANLKPDETPDSTATHAGLPVVKGAKWIATRWIRTRSYDAWG